MPSKYAKKQPKPITKQTSPLPYRNRFIPADQAMCSNCGRLDFASSRERFSKCYCGGTFQRYGVAYK